MHACICCVAAKESKDCGYENSKVRTFIGLLETDGGGFIILLEYTYVACLQHTSIAIYLRHTCIGMVFSGTTRASVHL